MGWEGRTRERLKKEWVMRWGGGIGGEREVEKGREREKDDERREKGDK